MNRRSFLSTSTAAMAGSLLARPLLLKAQVSPSLTSNVVLPALNPTLVSQVKGVFTNTNHLLNLQQCSAVQLEASSSSLTNLINNMQQTGYNAQFAPLLKTGLTNLIQTGTDKSGQVRATLSANGIQITSSQAELYFRPTTSLMQSFIGQLASPGLTTLELRMSAQLLAVAHQIQAQGIVDISQNGRLPQAHLRRVGCGTDGIAFGILSLLSPPPLDVIFGIVGLVYGVLDIAFNSACEPEPGFPTS
jgi:hypothetical protein